MLQLIPLAGAIVLSGCIAPNVPTTGGLAPSQRPLDGLLPAVFIKVVAATGSTGGS